MMLGIIEIFLFLCVVYYLFGKRTSDMVDIISTRLQEVYGSWSFSTEGIDAHHIPEERPTFDFLRRFGEQYRRQKAQDKVIELKTRERNLYQIKETIPNVISVPTKIVKGLACRYCAPENSEIQLDPRERRRDVVDVLRITKHANQGPDKSLFDWGTWFPIIVQCLRVKKYYFPEVSGQVLEDERLKTAIDQAALESVKEKKQLIRESNGTDDAFDEYNVYMAMLKEHNKRAKKIMMDMRAKLSNVLLQITSWLVYKLLPCFLTGAAAHPAQIEMLKSATERSPGTPLIFLPLHRSHLDYVLVTFMLLNNDIQCPVIAAGNNLRIPFFGEMLRGLGAFFIKRKIDPVMGKKDVVYRAILHSYLQHCLAAGHNAEFFIEGGRTRTGKPCIPKSGVLSVVVDAYMDGTVPDALLVPVSVNYERLVDGNFVAEHLGQRKPPETFMSAISAIWKAINSNYGLMRIDFNEPFSLQELVKSFKKIQDITVKADPSARNLQQNLSSSSLYGTDVIQEEHRSLVDSIARHVVYDCAIATTVMSTNAIAFLLLTKYRNGVYMNVFVKALNSLRHELENCKDLGFTGKSIDIIKYAVDLLGPGLIKVEKDNSGELFLKPVNMVSTMLELSYYANTLTPFYALESVVATAINILIKEDPNQKNAKEPFVSRENLIKLCLNYCDMLRYEFILNKPCQNLETLLNEVISKMCYKDLISIPTISYSEQEMWARRCAASLENNHDIEIDDDDDDDEYEKDYCRETKIDVELIYYKKEKRNDYNDLIEVLAPISIAYREVAFCLNRLLGNSMVEGEFAKICINEIRDRYNCGDCKYGESVSMEFIKNCIKLFEKWSVIEVESERGVRLLSLTNLYNSSNGIDTIYQRIQKFVPTINDQQSAV